MAYLSAGDTDEAEAYLAPMVKGRDGSWARIVTVDGEVDVYGLDRLATGVMINHASGRAIWDVMFELDASVVTPSCPSVRNLPHGSCGPI